VLTGGQVLDAEGLQAAAENDFGEESPVLAIPAVFLRTVAPLWYCSNCRTAAALAACAVDFDDARRFVPAARVATLPMHGAAEMFAPAEFPEHCCFVGAVTVVAV